MTFCNITKKECKNNGKCQSCEVSNNYEEFKENTNESETKIMRELATELQTHCHDGESNRKVKIRVLDAYYNVGSIKKIVAGDETYFVIETDNEKWGGVMKVDQVCGNCNFCEKNDGKPFCWLKDLYTTVELNQKCDEKDSRGRLMFAQKSEGQK